MATSLSVLSPDDWERAGGAGDSESCEAGAARAPGPAGCTDLRDLDGPDATAAGLFPARTGTAVVTGDPRDIGRLGPGLRIVEI